MAPSKCDQIKAEIIRQVQIKCSATTDRAKLEYKLKCQEVKDKYEIKVRQACHSLKQQELEELGEIKRLHEAKMEPIKVRNSQELSEARQLYQLAAPEVGLRPSAISETPNSPTLTALQQLAHRLKVENSKKGSAVSNRSFDDTQESSDETDTSIPAVAPQAANKTKHTPPSKKRKKRPVALESDEEESDFSLNNSRDEEDGASDATSQDLGQVFETFDGTSAQRIGRNNVPSASQKKTKNRFRRNEPNKNLETPERASSSSRKTDDQAERGDEDEVIHSGPASQAPRRNSARHGRPEPGKLKINLSSWGRL